MASTTSIVSEATLLALQAFERTHDLPAESPTKKEVVAMRARRKSFDNGDVAYELKGQGYSALDLKNSNFTLYELWSARYTAGELRLAGYSASDCRKIGYSAEQCHEGGFSALELYQASKT